MARHFSELITWQLADEIRRKVFPLTASPRIARDFKFRSQVEDAADSVCRNIAEGFGCRSHAEFARFLEIARRSANELADAMHSAVLKGMVTRQQTREIFVLFRRFHPALAKLIAYLRSTPDPPRIEGT